MLKKAREVKEVKKNEVSHKGHRKEEVQQVKKSLKLSRSDRTLQFSTSVEHRVKKWLVYHTEISITALFLRFLSGS